MTAVLQIQMLSFWRAGTGRDRPGALDATCQRDQLGLPMIPGKHLKGLLRDALRLAEEFEWTGLRPNDLFGGQTEAQLEEGLNISESGTLRVGSAVLPAQERAALENRPDLIEMLFETRRATRIEPNGTAAVGSLRFEEVAVPMTLEAVLTPMPGAPEAWQREIETALPLVRGVGALRTRGLGRCILSLDTSGAA